MDDLTLDEAAAIINHELTQAVDGAPKMAAGFRATRRALDDPEIKRAFDEGRLLDAQRMILGLADE